MAALHARSSPSIDETISLLLQRNLLAEEEIVSGALRIFASTSRNRHLRIDRAPQAFFIKCPELLAPGSLLTTANEAEFLQVASRCDERYRALLPRFILYEKEARLLVVELLRSHSTFAVHCSEQDYPQFPLSLCGWIGQVLAKLHALLSVDLPHWSALSLKSTPPWASEIHRPAVPNLGMISSAGLDVIRIVQQSSVISQAMDRVPSLWRPSCLIHGDVKADNVLIDTTGGDPPNVRLIDWEMVQIGDPLWDAAGLIQELLLLWIKHLDYGRDDDVDTMVAGAELPFVVIQTAIRCFWTEYKRGRKEASSASEELSTIVAHFVGVRLAQTAYEMTTNRFEIPAPVRLILQLCENILADTRGSAINILNIDVPDVAL